MNEQIDTGLPVNVAMAESRPPVTIGFTDGESFALAQRVGKMFAASSLVPKDFQNNLGNCAIAINMAARIGADPLMVMQNLYIVHGRPGWSSQFLIATFNNNPKFSALRYEFKGTEGQDDWSCRAWAIEKETQERLEGAWVSVGLAKKEGWYGKNGSKWQSMPEQMLRYRAASWFIRAYAPELAMGLQTAEELRETIDLESVGDGEYAAAKPVDLNTKVMGSEAAAAEATTPDDAWQETEPQTIEDTMGDEYAAMAPAERKKWIAAELKTYGVADADMHRAVGKSYSQWTTKDRVVLLEKLTSLREGKDPAQVFPTA